VECNDIDALEKEIIRVCETRPYSSEACIRRGRLFEDKKKFKEYVDLYSL
jgi:hypothetical protein